MEKKQSNIVYTLKSFLFNFALLITRKPYIINPSGSSDKVVSGYDIRLRRRQLEFAQIIINKWDLLNGLIPTGNWWLYLFLFRDDVDATFYLPETNTSSFLWLYSLHFVNIDTQVGGSENLRCVLFLKQSPMTVISTS